MVTAWIADVREATLEAYRAFYEREGHGLVPGLHNEDGFGLGAWVQRLRGAYAREMVSSVVIEKVELLPGWVWRVNIRRFSDISGGSDIAQIEEAYRAFYDREGHGLVPARHLEGIVKLGSLVHQRRVSFAAGKLPPQAVQLLEALPGWRWVARGNGALYEVEKAAFAKFYKREGHGFVARGHFEGRVSLGRFVEGRRLAYSRGSLSKETIDLLEAWPGWSWAGRGSGNWAMSRVSKGRQTDCSGSDGV